MDLRFERNANQSLGIAFNIPARVSAMNWVSQQRLVEISALSITSLHARVQFAPSFVLSIRIHPLCCLSWSCSLQIVCNIKKGSPAEGAEMKFGDIVARIDDHDCQSIEGFKEDINGKSNFTITVARCKGVNVEDIRSNHSP